MYRVPSLITMASASEILTEGTVAIENGETEFSLVHTAGSDSSAMAVLLSWQRRARRHGTTLRFLEVPPSVASFAALYGVDGFLPGFPATIEPPPVCCSAGYRPSMGHPQPN